MGLRINGNTSAMTALRNLHAADRAQTATLKRLSTGLRITTASDDPAGLVISEQLRSQIAALKQAVENTTFASNLIGTAEAALVEINNLLVGIKSSAVFAMSTGGHSAEQVAAQQDAVDAAIASIDRIAATTRFGSQHMLNGAAAFKTSNVGNGISKLTLRSTFFYNNASSVVISTDITDSAEKATLSLSANGSGNTILRIAGALGTEDITIASGATVSQVVQAINTVRGFTGIYASGVSAFSEEYGSAQQFTLQQVSGTYLGSTGTDYGDDLNVTIEGNTTIGRGLKVSINSSFLTGEVTFTSGAGVAADPTFDILNSGLTFQLKNHLNGLDRVTVGIENVSASSLGHAMVDRGASGGQIGGYLNSLVAGHANDLTSNPENAIRIVDHAIDQVSKMRAYLGAVEKDTLQANENALNVAVENLAKSESTIRDADFAAETTEFVRTQILFAAGTNVLAQANQIPQSIVQLLQR